MPKYLARAKFTRQGLEGLRAAGAASRFDMNRMAMESLGGTLECLYFAFGEWDMVAIIDVPNDEAAAAASLAANTAGAAQVEVVKLLTADQVDAALRLNPDYRPPGV